LESVIVAPFARSAAISASMRDSFEPEEDTASLARVMASSFEAVRVSAFSCASCWRVSTSAFCAASFCAFERPSNCAFAASRPSVFMT
jgi:hypothetical protein